MLDRTQLATALAAAAALSAAVMLLGAWLSRPARAPLVSAVGSVGVGGGLYLGCWLLGLWPHWPAREDLDRLLLIVVPAVVVVELAAVFLRRLPVCVVLLRWAVALRTAEVLLQDTTYLSDVAGPGSREWSSWERVKILSTLGVGLMIGWAALLRLERRTRSRAVPLALALDCAGAGVVVMLSGYASGGQIGLLLGAALFGVTTASIILPGLVDLRGAVSVGTVGLFAVLVIGLFFGQLTRTHAALLFLAPLLCWVTVLPPVRGLRPWLRGMAQLALVMIVVLVAVMQARHRFEEESGGPLGVSERTPSG